MQPVGEIEDVAAELARRTDELERSKRRFRDVIEHTADAIVVVDDAGVIQFANSAARKMFDMRREELVGTYFGFPLVADETTELDVISGGAPRSVEMRVVESEWEGMPARIASLRDITERKEAEEQARRLIREQTARAAAERSARTLRFLVDATTKLSSSLDYAKTLSVLANLCVTDIADWAVIYTVDDAGAVRRLEIAHCDKERAELARELASIPISVAGAHPVLEVLRTKMPKVVAHVTDATLDAMTGNAREREILRLLGIASFVIVPIIARNRPLGALALVSSKPDDVISEEDVTLAGDLAGRAALAIDNARLYGEARKANQSKADFLAVVSHDLRTPLNAIIGNADLLEQGIPEPLPDASLQSMRRIQMSARHLVYLLNELLFFARLDSGGETVSRHACDARQIVREVAVVMEGLANERSLSFEVSLPDAPVDLETDPDKLRQVLINLAGNAVKYTAHGSVLIALCEESADEVVITVRDTGMGIAPEHLEQVFEPFWQVKREQRSQGGGTGLGLSVVRRMLDLLRGMVSVESVLGNGSTFTVRLPRRAVPANSAAG